MEARRALFNLTGPNRMMHFQGLPNTEPLISLKNAPPPYLHRYRDPLALRVRGERESKDRRALSAVSGVLYLSESWGELGHHGGGCQEAAGEEARGRVL